MAADVIGEIQEGTGGGELAIPVFSISGTWPSGVTPGTLSLSCPGAEVKKQRSVMDVESPKTFIGGDSASGDVEIQQVYIDGSDWSELDEDNAIVTIRAQDRRVWWHSRPEYGPRSYNLEYRNERALRQYGTTAGSVGSVRPANDRYLLHTYRRMGDILMEIMDYLGVQRQDIVTDGTLGFMNLQGQNTAASYQTGQATTIWDDAPEWICPDGMSAVEGLQKFERMYGVTTLVSLDGKVGWLSTATYAERSQDTLDVIKGLSVSVGGQTWQAARSVSAGNDRDKLPNAAVIKGAPILIEDHLVLEPVLPDPDRPGQFLPLFRLDTLKAYGVDLNLDQRRHITDGEPCIRLATHLSVQANPWAEVPDILRGQAMQAFRLWRVAQPLRKPELAPLPGTTAPSAGYPGDLVTGVDASTGRPWERYISPIYPLHRDNQLDHLPQQLGAPHSRVVYEPPDRSKSAMPHRWLPLLPHRATIDADGAFHKLRVLGRNVVKRGKNAVSAGVAAPSWYDIGRLTTENHPGSLDAEDIGVEPRIVDPHTGVVDMGEPIFGCNGAVAGEGSTRSQLVDILDGVYTEGRHPPPELVWLRLEGLPNEERVRGGEGEQGGEADIHASPWGTAYLWLHVAFHKKSHHNERDRTLGVSARTGLYDDPWPHPTLTVENAFPLDRIRIGVGKTHPIHPLKVATIPLPDVQLRCRVPREKTALLSFKREGGTNSGKVEGECRFGDVDFAFGSALTAGALGAGTFAPVDDDHYDETFDALGAAVSALERHVLAFRNSQDALTAVNGDVLGWHRRFFPGVDDYGQAPVENIAFEVRAEPASCSMRLSVNARAYRPFTGSKQYRELRAQTIHRANTGAIAAITGGGGGVGGPTSTYVQGKAGQTQLDSSAQSPRLAGEEWRKPGLGATEGTTIDHRGKLSRSAAGGKLHARKDSSVMADKKTGTYAIKRRGGNLHTFVPRDWNDIVLQKAQDADGDDVFLNADGLRELFPSADEGYNSAVGVTAGTAHLASRALPILPAEQLGDDAGGRGPTHGDISIVCPEIYYKCGGRGNAFTLPPPKDEDGNDTRQSLEELTEGRRKIKYEDLEPLEIPTGETYVDPDTGEEKPVTEGQSLIEGKGYAALMCLMQEDLPLRAQSNALLVNSTVPSPFGGVLDTATVEEYLRIETTWTPLPVLGPGDHCHLPKIPPDALSGSSVDLNPYSHQVGIAVLAEYVENLAQNQIALIAYDAARRAHSLAKTTAFVLRELWCKLIEYLPEDNSHAELLQHLEDQVHYLEDICQTVCKGGGGEEVEPEEEEPEWHPPMANPPFTPPSTTPAPIRPGLPGHPGGPAGPPAPPSGPVGPPAPSDVRLKRNLRRIGALPCGLGLYVWRWNATAQRLGLDVWPTVGVIAQEVAILQPDAVAVAPDGFYRVDYGRLP